MNADYTHILFRIANALERISDALELQNESDPWIPNHEQAAADRSSEDLSPNKGKVLCD